MEDNIWAIFILYVYSKILNFNARKEFKSVLESTEKYLLFYNVKIYFLVAIWKYMYI